MNAIADQPAPTPNNHPPIVDLVVADLAERKRVGIERYGVALQPHNGRDALVDAYQEAMDLTLYLRQAIEERSGVGAPAQVERLRTALARSEAACQSIADQHREALALAAKAVRERDECRTIIDETRRVLAELVAKSGGTVDLCDVEALLSVGPLGTSEQSAVLPGTILGYRSPEGFIHASAGARYEQLQPGGATVSWVKTTPDGATGWKQLAGDTTESDPRTERHRAYVKPEVHDGTGLPCVCCGLTKHGLFCCGLPYCDECVAACHACDNEIGPGGTTDG